MQDSIHVQVIPAAKLFVDEMLQGSCHTMPLPAVAPAPPPVHQGNHQAGKEMLSKSRQLLEHPHCVGPCPLLSLLKHHCFELLARA
jgi:hypothetical protein